MTRPKEAPSTASAFDSSQPLTFLKHLANEDAYLRGQSPGGVLIAIPGIWDSMPADLLASMRARRAANVTGRCPECDAVFNVGSAAIWHESACSASDDRLGPQLEGWGRRVGRYARGRRIVEDPVSGAKR